MKVTRIDDCTVMTEPEFTGYVADGVDVWKVEDGVRVRWIGRMNFDAARILVKALNEGFGK